jgi:hypothetical protein
MAESVGLPRYVDWPLFPFEGDLRLKEILPLADSDFVRSGEPGGPPCPSCAAVDDDYVWVDEHWRVRATDRPPSVPMQLFLETRAHLDMHQLEDDRAAELGQLLVRLDRAVTAIGGVGRVHVNRWGDGGEHFHMWIYGRPFGTRQVVGFGVPLWAAVLPPIDEHDWRRSLAVVAEELARGGGRAIAGS